MTGEGPAVARHVVAIGSSRFGHRHVHYRTAGAPAPAPVAALALHPSPRSSAVLGPVLTEWARDFHVIAPDMPGYGGSDPFPPAVADTVSLDDLADATVEFMDAVGIERAALYGEHTGAMLACVVALHYPSRVHAVAANGVAVLTHGERADWLAHHLPPFVPAADGSHLAALWHRAVAQQVWFPWFHQDDEHRIAPGSHTAPSPDEVQRYVDDVVAAGDNYRVAYRAAIAHPIGQTLAGLAVPTLVTAAAGDVLAPHLERLAPVNVSAAVTIEAGASAPETRDRCRRFLAAATVGPG